MLRTMRAVFVIMLIVLWAVQTLAQEPPSGRWWQSPKVIKALNLTSGEIQQLEKAFEKSRRKMIDQKNKVEREQFELSRMMENRNLDEKAIRAQNRKLENARSDLADAKFAFVIDVRRIIGAGRFQRLLELKP